MTQPVLGNHVHFIVEADSAEALSHGMQGLSIRIAKALNAVMGCAGSVFDGLSVPVSWLLSIGWRKASTPDLDRLSGSTFVNSQIA